jgi:hypothetical protein
MKIYKILSILFIYFKIPKYLTITHLVVKSEKPTHITYSTGSYGGLFSNFAMSPWFDCGDFYAEVYEIEFNFFGFVKLKKVDKIQKFIPIEKIILK